MVQGSSAQRRSWRVSQPCHGSSSRGSLALRRLTLHRALNYCRACVSCDGGGQMNGKTMCGPGPQQVCHCATIHSGTRQTCICTVGPLVIIAALMIFFLFTLKKGCSIFLKIVNHCKTVIKGHILDIQCGSGSRAVTSRWVWIQPPVSFVCMFSLCCMAFFHTLWFSPTVQGYAGSHPCIVVRTQRFTEKCHLDILQNVLHSKCKWTKAGPCEKSVGEYSSH